MSDSKDKGAAPPPTGKTLAKMQGGAQIQAIVPTTLGECFALAEMIFKTGLSIPRDVDTPQKLTMIFLKGMELGLPPMAAMESIGIINGRAALYGDGIPSLLWSRGFKLKETYRNDEMLDTCIARCEITRPDGDVYEFEYSAQDAIQNGLWNPKERDEKRLKAPWQRYTKRMLRMRARGWLARDCASDVLKGIPVYEEQADIELERSDYREVRPTALVVPDDIPGDEPAAATVSEAEAPQDALIADEPAYLERLAEQLQTAESQSDYDECWEAHLELVEAGRISREGQAKAGAINEECAKRFAGA